MSEQEESHGIECPGEYGSDEEEEHVEGEDVHASPYHPHP